jgi:hypothetical protein
VEGGSSAGRNFDSLQVEGHRVALIEGTGEHSSGTRGQVVRDYGMRDRGAYSVDSIDRRYRNGIGSVTAPMRV